MAAHEFSQGGTKLVPGGIAPDRIILRIRLIHFLSGRVALEDGAQNWRRAGTDGAVVEVNFVGWNEELFADLSPVGILVFGKQIRVWKGAGSLLELSDQTATKRKGSSQASGEKAAAIEQKAPPNG